MLATRLYMGLCTPSSYGMASLGTPSLDVPLPPWLWHTPCWTLRSHQGSTFTCLRGQPRS